MRRRCVKHGHRWVKYVDGYRFPVQFCGRWFCRAARPDPMLPLDLQAKIDQDIAAGTIDEEQQHG